jgi:hypothetical protein
MQSGNVYIKVEAAESKLKTCHTGTFFEKVINKNETVIMCLEIHIIKII